MTIGYSGAGVPLWTNLYNGPADYWDGASAVAVDGNGNVFVTGWSQTSSNGNESDFVTIKYSSVSPQPVHLTIGRTTTNTVVIAWPSPSTGFVLQGEGQCRIRLDGKLVDVEVDANASRRVDSQRVGRDRPGRRGWPRHIHPFGFDHGVAFRRLKVRDQLVIAAGREPIVNLKRSVSDIFGMNVLQVRQFLADDDQMNQLFVIDLEALDRRAVSFVQP